MNTKEILQIYGPVMSHLSDKKLYDFINNKVYCQIGHGVSRDYWVKAFGSCGYIKPENIRKHIEDACNETGSYSEVAMAVGLKRYRARKAEERRIAQYKL